MKAVSIPLVIKIFCDDEVVLDDMKQQIRQQLKLFYPPVVDLPIEFLHEKPHSLSGFEQLVVVNGSDSAMQYKLLALNGETKKSELRLKPMEQTDVFPVLDLSESNTEDSLWFFPSSWGDQGHGRDRFLTMLQDLIAINSEINIAFDSDKDIAGIKQSKDWFFDDDSSLKEPKLSWLDELLNLFSVCDYLAIQYQKRRNSSLIILTFSVLFVSLFLNLSGFFGLPTLFIGISIMAGVFIFYRKVRKRRYEWRYYSYRSLAELLRIYIFWRLAGVSENPADHFLDKYDTSFSWIRSTLSFFQNKYESVSEATSNPNFVHKNWISVQKNYFEKTLKRHKKKSSGNVKTGKILLSIGIFNTIFFIGVSVVKRYIPSVGQFLGPLPEVGRITISLFIQLGTLLSAYVEMMGYKELTANYSMTYQLFETAENVIQKQVDPKTVILELGKESLKEHEAWLLLHQNKLIQNPLLKVKR